MSAQKHTQTKSYLARLLLFCLIMAILLLGSYYTNNPNQLTNLSQLIRQASIQQAGQADLQSTTDHDLPDNSLNNDSKINIAPSKDKNININTNKQEQLPPKQEQTQVVCFEEQPSNIPDFGYSGVLYPTLTNNENRYAKENQLYQSTNKLFGYNPYPHIPIQKPINITFNDNSNDNGNINNDNSKSNPFAKYHSSNININISNENKNPLNPLANWSYSDSIKLQKRLQHELFQENIHDCSYKGKVFGIGIMKTGTTSIVKALEILGYGRYVFKDGIKNWDIVKKTRRFWMTSTYNRIDPWINITKAKKINQEYKQFETLNFEPPYLDAVDDISWIFSLGNLNTADANDNDSGTNANSKHIKQKHKVSLLRYIIWMSYHGFAFGDAPWLYLYSLFDQWYPNSKFVLTVRNTTYDVIKSGLKMRLRGDFRFNIDESFIKLVENFGNEQFKVEKGSNDEIILNEFVRFAKKTGTNYEIHNFKVQKYFQNKKLNDNINSINQATSEFDNNLLVINFEKEQDPWIPLMKFLDCKIHPNETFPRVNQAPRNQHNSQLNENIDALFESIGLKEKLYVDKTYDYDMTLSSLQSAERFGKRYHFDNNFNNATFFDELPKMYPSRTC